MKRFILGFILGLGLAHVANVRAQDQQKPCNGDPCQQWDGQAHYATSDLTVREIVEIMAEFDVKHVDQQPFSMPAFGVTAFDSAPPAIWLFNVGDLSSRESTLIHELIHVKCRRAVLTCSDDYVSVEEDRQYKAIFGAKP